MIKEKYSIKGYFFYPIMLFELILLCWVNITWFLIGLLLFLSIRIIRLKEKKIIIICLVSILLASGYFFITKSQRINTIDESKKQTWTLLPDALNVDGDFVKAIVKQKRKKYVLRYKLTSKEEKDKVLSIKRPIKLTTKQEEVVPQGKRNLNGFDYANYLQTKEIIGVYDIKEIQNIREKRLSLWHPGELISVGRANLHHYINERFLPYTSFYMNSLLLGINEGDNREVWRKLSLSHLFALSGIHVTFFISMIRTIFLRIGVTREKTSFIEGVSIICFIGLTGYSVGVIRAGIQHIIKQTNHNSNYSLSTLDCWSITLLIHSLVYPSVLLTIGGQLSYYLSFLIIFIHPIVAKEKGLKQMILFQSLLTFFSIPIICYYFFEFNFLSSIFSLIFTPVLFQIVLPLLVVTLFIAKVLPVFLIEMVEMIIKGIHLLAEYCQNLTFFQFTIGTLPFVLLILIIISQMLFLVKLEESKKVTVKQIMFLVVSPCLFITIKWLNPFGMIAFVDVGQGDAIFIQQPFHRGNYLIDTGGTLDFQKEDWKMRQNKKQNADFTLIPFLKSKGVSTIDGVFITHAHEDHFGDIDRVSQEININQVFVTPGSYNQKNLQQKLAKENLTSVITVDSNKQIKLPGIETKIIHPSNIGDGQNNDSLVIKLVIRNKSFLLMGDLEKEGEDKLIKQYPLDLQADCIKIGHHGSKTSSQSHFIQAVNPSEAIISVGENNRFKHPSPETLDTLNQYQITIYRTDEQGMIYQKWLPWKKEMLKIKSVK